MGYLLHILLAVAALAAAQAGHGRVLVRAEVAAGVFLLPYLTAALVRRAGERGRFRQAALWARLSGLAPVVAYAAFVLGTDWLDLVRGWTGAELSLDSWPELGLALVYAPFVVGQLLGLHAEARAHDPRPQVRRRVLAFQVRMFCAALLPLFLYLGISALVGAVPGWRERIEQVALYNALFVSVLMACLAFVLPTLLSNTWETVRLADGPQRALLDAVARRAEFHPRDVRVWRTGNLMANAAILGIGARRRVVLFSDSLLTLLGPGELAAVYAHEIGHAKRRHVAVFLAWALAFFLFADLLTQWIPSDDPWTEGGILVGALALWWIGFGWLSRRCELEADLFGVELLGDPGAMASALERVGGRLRDVAGWRHFSTSERVAFLWRAWREPRFAARFRRRLRVLAWIGTALCATAVGLEGWVLLSSYRQDMVHAELALGRWDRALERARAIDGYEQDDLVVLQQGAARQPHDAPLDADALADLLAGELAERAPLDRAASTAGLLAVLRPSTASLAEWLAVLVGDRRAPAPEDCPPEWEQRVRERLAAGG